LYNILSDVIHSAWHYDIVLNGMPTQQKKKVMTQNGSFYGELEQVFDQFPKNHIKILSADFSTKLWRKANLPH